MHELAVQEVFKYRQALKYQLMMNSEKQVKDQYGKTSLKSLHENYGVTQNIHDDPGD